VTSAEAASSTSVTPRAGRWRWRLNPATRRSWSRVVARSAGSA